MRTTPMERLLSGIVTRLEKMERQVTKMQSIPVYGKDIKTPGTITASGNISTDADILVGGKLAPSNGPITIAAGDTSPDVSGGNLFVAAAGTQAITEFDAGEGTPTSGHRIVILNRSTISYVHNQVGATYPLILGNGADFDTNVTGTVSEFVYNSTDGQWEEVNRWTANPELSTLTTLSGAVIGDSLTVDNALAVGGNASVAGTTTLSGAVDGTLAPSSVTTMTASDGSPDVSGKRTLYSAGTGVINGLDYGSGGEPDEGHEVTVMLKSAVDFNHNITISNPYPLLLPGSVNWTTGAEGDSIRFQYNGTAWQCTGRSINN